MLASIISSVPMPRVLMVDPNANTPPYDHALCAALAGAGWQVTLATSPFLYEALPHPTGFKLEHVFFGATLGRLARASGLAHRAWVRRTGKALEYPLNWLALVARARRDAVDVVHVQWSLDPTFDRAVWSILKGLGCPVVYTVHNLLPHARRRGDVDRYRRLYRAASGLVAHTSATAAVLRRRFGVHDLPIAVAPHGPLLEEQACLTRGAARAKLGLPAGVPIVLFAGLVEPYKGLDDLIDAFGLLARQDRSAWLVVAGRPNYPAETSRSRLEARGLAERTRFDLRFLPREELAAYLCAADVVALPYREVTSSGMLLSALRFARPVVATAVGDLAELIRDGETGVLVPPGDPEALAGALERILRDPDLGRRLGAAGRRATIEQGSWERAARETIGLYRRVIGRAAA